MPKDVAKKPREREGSTRDVRSPLQVVVRLVLVALMILLLLGFAVAVVRLISRPELAEAARALPLLTHL